MQYIYTCICIRVHMYICAHVYVYVICIYAHAILFHCDMSQCSMVKRAAMAWFVSWRLLLWRPRNFEFSAPSIRRRSRLPEQAEQAEQAEQRSGWFEAVWSRKLPRPSPQVAQRIGCLLCLEQDLIFMPQVSVVKISLRWERASVFFQGGWLRGTSCVSCELMFSAK